MIGTVNIIYTTTMDHFLAYFFQAKNRENFVKSSGAIGDGLKET